MLFRNFLIQLTLLVLGIAFSAQSHALRGACGDRSLPSNKIRKVSDIHLKCSSNSSHYIRRRQAYDFNEWRTLLKMSQGKNKAQKWRQQVQPLIKWSGQIPYSTVEVWTWVDYVYGQHPSCGFEEICNTYTDSNGDTRKSCTSVMKSCWHDETRHESRHCSNEILDFTAEYVRPSLALWNPSAEGYYDVIPNKYDLLPGEVEDAQVFSNTSLRRNLEPAVNIGNAWNKYSNETQFRTGGSSKQCRMNASHKVHVAVHTIERDNTKKTPNAFGPPIDHHGREKEFISAGSKDENGDLLMRPRKVKLSDSSSRLVSVMAKQSRKQTVDIYKAQKEMGIGANVKQPTSEEESEERRALNEATGFYKDTQIRVRLIKETGFLQRDIIESKPIIMSGTRVQTNLDSYSIFLEGTSHENDFYRGYGPYIDWSILGVHLEPNKKYKIAVSMFQSGVPFYLQDCSEQYRFSDCSVHTVFIKPLKRDHFSKELEISFKTSKDMEDDRSFFQRFDDWLQKSLFDKMKGFIGL